MRRLLVLLCLLAGPPAHAQDEDESYQRDRLWSLVRAAGHFSGGCSDQGEEALALWAWRLESGETARARVAAAQDLHAHSCADDPAAQALLAALLDPPPLPAVDDAPLESLLVTPPGESVLERAVRSARFTRGLDRVPLSVALAPLDPRHPWVEDVRVRAARVEPVLLGIARMFDMLALPIDPRVNERVSLMWLNVDAWADELWGVDGKASGGWVLARTATHLTILDDRLRRGQVPVTRTAPADVDEELRRWSALDEPACVYGREALDARSCGAGALRAWWALKRGRVWTAARIAEEACVHGDDDAAERLARIAAELVGAVRAATLVDHGKHHPRADTVAALRRASAVLDLAPGLDDHGFDDHSVPVDVDLADRLEVQDRVLRRAPPPPSSSAWQRLSPAERVPHLIRALPDCDGVSPAGELVEVGELAIPALIEAMSDRAPTRWVRSHGDAPPRLLTVGQCASRVLRAIIDGCAAPVSFLNEDPYSDQQDDALERQACARAWWADVVAHGGLMTLQLVRLLELDRAPSWTSRDHQALVRWLLRHGKGREVDLLRAVVAAAPSSNERASWIRELGRAPHDGFDALLGAELAAEDDRVAMAAASAFLERGDRRGVPRALAFAVDWRSSDDTVAGALDVLGQADAPELAALALQLVATRPAFDGALQSALVGARPSPERLLTLARIAARPSELPPFDLDPDAPARLAIEALEPIPPGGRATVAAADRTRIIVNALAEALRTRARPDALEHAALTCALLGPEALAALGAASGHDLRPALLAAARHRDVARLNAASVALDRLEAPGLRWLVDGATDVPEEVRAAIQRVSLRVVRVEVVPEAPGGVRAAVASWRGEPLDLDRVSDVLEAWELADMDALALVISRPASGGVRVSVTCPLAGPDAPGWLLRVAAGGAGLVHDSATTDTLPPSCRSTHALAQLQNALVDHPEVSTRIVIRAER